MTDLLRLVALTAILYSPCFVHAQEASLTKAAVEAAIEQVWQRRSAELRGALEEEFEGNVKRSLESIERSLEQRFDKQLAAPAILELSNK